MSLLVGKDRLTGKYVICKDGEIIDFCPNRYVAEKRKQALQGLMREEHGQKSPATGENKIDESRGSGGLLRREDSENEGSLSKEEGNRR